MISGITFYVKFQGNNIPIRTVRSCDILYSAFENNVPDGDVAPLSKKIIFLAKKFCDERIKIAEKDIEEGKETIKAIIDMKDDINTKLEVIYDIRGNIFEIKKVIENAKDALQFCRFLDELIEQLPPDKNPDEYVYAGIDAWDGISAYAENVVPRTNDRG
jgi:hypothetical protein